MAEQGARAKAPLDVFRYLDYRAFLGDLYRSQKARGLSYRAFARKASLGAPNYLKLVIEGQRNLTPSMALRFATASGLSGDAADYFVQLVAFCQARSAQTKAEHFEQLKSFKRYREAQTLQLSHAEYHANWYLPAIRELIGSPGFREDAELIASALIPPIKPSAVKRAIKVLLRLGLVARDPEGRLQQTAAIVSTGAETQGLHIVRYHREMMEQALSSIELVDKPERDISALTVCVSDAGLARLKRRVQEMRRELLQMAERDLTRDRVVQLNVQLFPLSRKLPTPPQRKRRNTENQDA